MASTTLRSADGSQKGTVQLDDHIFGIEPNVLVLHQVVTAQLAARRSGTQSTKTRAEVRGGGTKPWKQKGTGRARAGSIRSPMWRGGGVALGPKPRSYAQRTPKKMVNLALRSALSDRAADGKIVVIESHGLDAPRTKDAVALLTTLGVEGRVMVVLSPEDEAGWKSFRNLPQVQLLVPGQLNAYDVLVNDWIVFTAESLPSAHAAAPTTKKAATTKTAAAPATKAASTAPTTAEPAAAAAAPVKAVAKRVARPKPAAEADAADAGSTEEGEASS